jgi:16S rRNA processing protein RimM
MRVHDPALNFNGRIQEILDAGGNRVLVVKDKDDREVMIPAVKEFIKEIDSTAHLCIVNIPKGLLELNHA